MTALLLLTLLTHSGHENEPADGPYKAPQPRADLQGLPGPIVDGSVKCTRERPCLPPELADGIARYLRECKELPGRYQVRLDWLRRYHASDIAGATEVAYRRGQTATSEPAVSFLQVAGVITGAVAVGVLGTLAWQTWGP